MRGVILRSFAFIGLLAIFLATLGCARSPADESVDRQLKEARERGVYVTPEQERQLREAAHRGLDREREVLRQNQNAATERGENVKVPIR